MSENEMQNIEIVGCSIKNGDVAEIGIRYKDSPSFSMYSSSSEIMQDLKAQLKEAEKVIDFYGDECFVPRTKDASDWCKASDLEHIKQDNGLHYDLGGKKAREYKTKYTKEAEK